MKILIATTNPGKLEEFKAEFKDLKIDFVSLADLGLDSTEVDEPYTELWLNAKHKAEYFAKKSGLTTIAEDTGFYVDFLNGAPGIKAKRYAATGSARINKVLSKLKGVNNSERGAYFLTNGCIFDPEKGSFSIFEGKASGRIANQASKQNERSGMDYDAIFYYPPLKKLFSDLSILEKNQVSHRGQVINQIKYHLMRHYAFRQLLVPTALIVNNRKMLLLKRRDQRKEFNNHWEFPGGAVEVGKEINETLLREINEETGLKVGILEQLPDIMSQTESKYHYRVFLMVFVCNIIGGELKLADNEVSDFGWFSIKEALRLDFLPLNKKCIQQNQSILSKYVD